MNLFASLLLLPLACLAHLTLCVRLLWVAVKHVRGRATRADSSDTSVLLLCMVVSAMLIVIPLALIVGFPSLGELTDPYSYPRQLAWEHLGWAFMVYTPLLPLLAFLPWVSRRMNLVILFTSIASLSSLLLPIQFLYSLLTLV